MKKKSTTDVASHGCHSERRAARDDGLAQPAGWQMLHSDWQLGRSSDVHADRTLALVQENGFQSRATEAEITSCLIPTPPENIPKNSLIPHVPEQFLALSALLPQTPVAHIAFAVCCEPCCQIARDLWLQVQKNPIGRPDEVPARKFKLF
ncbi:hypothetical protein DPX16_5146 [Anabarilius grahami]|uniref:Uncharacterized protein n=1 Tax=Anabarilius grahami TaxID=495550 RepID=A0A3N0XL02_ANAGA|nr:hypothetical protein DPX16_5146 [Anabarilius grahami]